MSIDVTQIRYGVSVQSPSGGVSNLSGAILDLSWEEREGELAQRATIKLKDNSGVKLNCPVAISANGSTVFQGFVWQWEYSASSKQEVTLIAYDWLIRLQKSKDCRYYQGGMDTKSIISDICSDWGVPLEYNWASISHEKKSFRGQTLSNMIVGLLDEVKKKTGQKYVLRFKGGTLQIDYPGTNGTVYVFSGENTISTKNVLTMDNLVTRVKIIGKENNQGRTPVEGVVDGRLEFGVLQEILIRDSDKSIGEAKKEAQTLINQKGTPEETLQVTAPDLPFLRKGDKVRVSAGNLMGYFNLLGITHNATARTMNMELERA